jgi:hypothetical protein
VGFGFFVNFLREIALFLGATIIWLFTDKRNANASFMSFVWEKGIQTPEWIQILVGFVFIVLIILIIVAIYKF